ncbi:uncharacterized protein LOC106877637 [Octopus bimaculoides]|nr:uncharacterized protein LOC106877637 [Octopus bimaculoides]
MHRWEQYKYQISLRIFVGNTKILLPTYAICFIFKNMTMASTSLLVCLFVTVFVGLLATPTTANANWIAGAGYHGGYNHPIGLSDILLNIRPYVDTLVHTENPGITAYHIPHMNFVYNSNDQYPHYSGADYTYGNYPAENYPFVHY